MKDTKLFTVNVGATLALPYYMGSLRAGNEGMCCMGDPPGFPSYYLQPLYNRHGNTPHDAPQAVLMDHIVFDANYAGDFKDRERVLKTLWNPLPYEHPRVQSWIGSLYAFYRNSYKAPEPNEDISFGGPQGRTLDDHMAYQTICRFYPQHAQDRENAEKMRLDPPAWGKGGDGSWWRKLSDKPTPDQCPEHCKYDKTWCQFCGWVAP